MSLKNISLLSHTSRQCIYRILKKLNKILIKKYYEALPCIGGDDIIVEIDESKFGKRKFNRGRKVEGVWVFGMVERTQ
ncbi:hypothetical protein H311_03940, partial [Anncaliia algerae PRA109]